MCGARYFEEQIAPNGHWSTTIRSFDSVLAEHNIQGGFLGCYNGRVCATPDNNRVVVPLLFRIGILPNGDSDKGALENTYHAYIT